jgi:putative transcriptional regulator
MGKTFDSIARGLNEAISHAKGEKVAVTQEQFAARFGFSVATLRHWERGDRTPQGAALVLLNVIKRAPDAVTAALS